MSLDNTIFCREATPLRATSAKPWKEGETVEFMYMPAGVHTITAGFRDKAIRLTVAVDPKEAAAVAQASLNTQTAAAPKQKPFGCVEHKEQEASVWAKGFSAREDGVYLAAEPSALGAFNVNGRIHRSWSPSFMTDADYAKAKEVDGLYFFPEGVRGSASNPARITGVAFCVGTLTNKPAFKAISPVRARQAMSDDAVMAAQQRGAKGRYVSGGGDSQPSLAEAQRLSKVAKTADGHDAAAQALDDAGGDADQINKHLGEADRLRRGKQRSPGTDLSRKIKHHQDKAFECEKLVRAFPASKEKRNAYQASVIAHSASADAHESDDIEGHSSAAAEHIQAYRWHADTGNTKLANEHRKYAEEHSARVRELKATDRTPESILHNLSVKASSNKTMSTKTPFSVLKDLSKRLTGKTLVEVFGGGDAVKAYLRHLDIQHNPGQVKTTDHTPSDETITAGDNPGAYFSNVIHAVHVRQHTRITPTGKLAVVKEHEDARSKHAKEAQRLRDRADRDNPAVRRMSDAHDTSSYAHKASSNAHKGLGSHETAASAHMTAAEAHDAAGNRKLAQRHREWAKAHEAQQGGGGLVLPHPEGGEIHVRKMDRGYQVFRVKDGKEEWGGTYGDDGLERAKKHAEHLLTLPMTFHEEPKYDRSLEKHPGFKAVQNLGIVENNEPHEADLVHSAGSHIKDFKSALDAAAAMSLDELDEHANHIASGDEGKRSPKSNKHLDRLLLGLYGQDGIGPDDEEEQESKGSGALSRLNNHVDGDNIYHDPKEAAKLSGADLDQAMAAYGAMTEAEFDRHADHLAGQGGKPSKKSNEHLDKIIKKMYGLEEGNDTTPATPEGVKEHKPAPKTAHIEGLTASKEAHQASAEAYKATIKALNSDSDEDHRNAYDLHEEAAALHDKAYEATNGDIDHKGKSDEHINLAEELHGHVR